MKEKKKTGEAGLMRRLWKSPPFIDIISPPPTNPNPPTKRDEGKSKLIKALSAFNRRYRSRQREEKE